MSQEKLQTINDFAKFWGLKEVYYGICASREYLNKITKKHSWEDSNRVAANRLFSQDVTPAVLVLQNNQTAAM